MSDFQDVILAEHHDESANEYGIMPYLPLEMWNLIFTALRDSYELQGATLMDDIRAISKTMAISHQHHANLPAYLASRAIRQIRGPNAPPMIYCRDLLFSGDPYLDLSPFDTDDGNLSINRRPGYRNGGSVSIFISCSFGMHNCTLEMDCRTKMITMMEYAIYNPDVGLEMDIICDIVLLPTTILVEGVAVPLDDIPRELPQEEYQEEKDFRQQIVDVGGYPAFVLRFLSALFPRNQDDDALPHRATSILF